MIFIHPVLDRVVTYKRLTRRTYTWWRYTIKDNKITIIPLKDGLPSLDVIFNALLRDIEFIHLFMNDKYIINKDNNMISHVDLNNDRYFTLFKDNEYKKLFKIDLQSKEIGEPIIELPLDNFLSVLHHFYPKYVLEEVIISNIIELNSKNIFFIFNITSIKDKKTSYYYNSYIKLVDKFKLMNSDINTNYIFSRHFAGFTKGKKRLLGVFSYYIIDKWDEKYFKKNLTHRELLQEVYSKNLSMIYTIYFKNNYEIKDKMNRKFINNMMQLFDNNDFIFYTR